MVFERGWRWTKALALGALLSLTLGSALGQQQGGTFTVIRDAGTLAAYNLNPFESAASALYPTDSAIYESLFYVNPLTGDVEPVLGTDYSWDDEVLNLTVDIRQGVEWNDGEPFTAQDVVYTFNLMRDNPALGGTVFWSRNLQEVTAPDDHTVVFTFDSPDTTIFPYIAHQLIVPEHVWSEVEDPVTFTNEQPVATGPFLFDSYSQQAIRVVRNPNYWMEGRPYVDDIVWKIVGGTDAMLLNMLRGEGDYAYMNIPDVMNTYVSRNPETNQIFWPVQNTNFLFLNTGKAPFDDVAFRRALATAIDTDEVALRAYSGLIDAGHPSGVIPTQREQWLSSTALEADYGFDAEAADQMLRDAGYETDSSGARLDPEGDRLPTFNILVGAGWVDFIAMAQVIGENLRALGINTNIDQQTWGTYYGGLESGEFDMAITWGWGTGETPYQLYNASFAPDLTAPIGEAASSNFGRYTHPEITDALKRFRESADEDVKSEAIARIADIVVEEVPMIALTDRVSFNTYNTTRFTGFPTDENPYNDASPDDVLGARLMFLNVHLK